MFLQLLTGLSLLEIVLGAGCDQDFTGSSGVVTSPEYSTRSFYANNQYCQYDIEVDFGTQIKLTWSKFDIKGKMPYCTDDYVEIYIGCGRHSIGKYCSDNSYTPHAIYSPDNCLRIKFRSDSSGSGQGFSASYSSISTLGSRLKSVCYSKSGNTLYGNSGIVSSNKWPKDYSSLQDCYWKLDVGSNKNVKIAFMDVDLKYDYGCDDDKVKVKGGRDYQSYDSSSTIKDSMCGRKSAFYFTSTKERIWIRFKSNRFPNGRGFVAGYVLYDSTGCDQDFTGSFGVVTSPEYYTRSFYANNQSCQYDITVDFGKQIKLTWSIFDIKGKMPSCTDDYVEIYIGCGRHSIGKYCSDNSYTPHAIYSPDNCLHIKFRSDGSRSGRGFSASYSTISSFGSGLFSICYSKFGKTLYGNSGIVSTNNWPRNYSSLKDCYWKLEVGSNKNVKIAFMDVDLEYDLGCDVDKVKVKGGKDYQSYDLSSTIKDSMCGTKSAFYFTSTKERIWIRFKSNSFHSGRGFVAGYVLYDSPGCDQDFTLSSGLVTSPEYHTRSSYANNQNCQYDIKVDFGRIKLTWSTFDIKGKMPSCTDDYVEIYIGCGRHSIGKYCSDNSYKPHTIYSLDNCLRIKFRSDSSGSGRGFSASYSTIPYFSSNLPSNCSSKSGERLYGNSGIVSTNNWPRDYSSLKDCYWKLDVGSSKNVKIAFMDLDLEYDLGCDDDKVKIKGGKDYQSYDSSSTIKDSMCGTKFAFYFTSTKERIWIRFKSNSFYSGRGFVAGYVLYDSTSGSSSGASGSPGRLSGSVVAGIVVGIIVLLVFAGCIYYVFVYRKRLAMRQATQQHAMTAQVHAPPPHTVGHHPPPPNHPGYGPPPPAGYAPPPPAGYALPPLAGYAPPPQPGYAPPPQPGYAPPPYSQTVTAPYPQQEKPGQYPPAPQGGAPPYPPEQPGVAPPYLPGQSGEAPPYPPGQPADAPSGGTAPYPSAPPAGAPYPPK